MSDEEIKAEIRRIYTLPFYYDDYGTMIFDQKGMVLDVRSWGRLTGTGAQNLPEDRAIKIQDALGHRVAEILNKHWND